MSRYVYFTITYYFMCILKQILFLLKRLKILNAGLFLVTKYFHHCYRLQTVYITL